MVERYLGDIAWIIIVTPTVHPVQQNLMFSFSNIIIGANITEINPSDRPDQCSAIVECRVPRLFLYLHTNCTHCAPTGDRPLI